MNQEAGVRRIGWGLVVIGVVLAAVAGVFAIREGGKTSDWVETEGVVIDVKTDDAGDTDTIIRYRDPAEKVFEFTSEYGLPDSRRGDKVVVQYDPANPNDALLADESTGFSSHLYFVVGFALLAVWGLIIALFDPKLTPVTGRPGGIAAITIWIVLTSVIGLLTQKGNASGFWSIALWAMTAVGLLAAFGLWRMYRWGLWGSMGYSAVVIIALLISWARNDNRFGAPLFWNLILLALWGSALWTLSRPAVAASFERVHAAAMNAQ